MLENYNSDNSFPFHALLLYGFLFHFIFLFYKHKSISIALYSQCSFRLPKLLIIFYYYSSLHLRLFTGKPSYFTLTLDKILLNIEF